MARMESIGDWRGVSIGVAAWDAVAAEVELSCACMASREAGRTAPAGGLAHLDSALGGALTGLRSAGFFAADPLETLLIATPPPGVKAGAILVVGVGDPDLWSTAVTAKAAGCAAAFAMQLGKASAAFAPGMLDEGMDPAKTADAAPRMMKAVLRAIDSRFALADHGLAPAPSLRQWIFDVGAPRFADAAVRFKNALHEARLSDPVANGE